ncbi:CHAT domain-containing protein [Chloroflexi bacterium TSY]|nr:CHAT domain-containing protein [Chloroflexi bacterium TSY]
MISEKNQPIIFLAFANDRQSGLHYLRNLPEEARNLRETLEQAERDELCQVILRQNVTIDEILDVFQSAENRNRITIFHYGGHANSYHLLLQTASGDPALAYAGGFAAFLDQQIGLELVFLNGCSTELQTQGLLDAGVSVVIGTSQAIDDQVATDFATRFYRGLASGITIQRAFNEAAAAIKMAKGEQTRHLYLTPSDSRVSFANDRWPWNLRLRDGAGITLEWNLPYAANNPLFGLPSLPQMDLPKRPFRYLDWFHREDAPVFFGRGQQIRDLYLRVTNPSGAPILLLYGKSGVGKSSLLAAGLLPRLEESYEITYCRRDLQTGMLGTLRAALETSITSESETHLGNAWLARETELNKPLIVIIDQVEELYTRPNHNNPDEFTEFLAALHTIFIDPAKRLQGKLILSFRKEWLAEIKGQISEHKLPVVEFFLERLDQMSITEAVSGIASTKRLIQQYNLNIDDDLPELIANDLLKDPESAIAPTLQILLTKLWEKATHFSYDERRFDRLRYYELKREGLDLKDFLDQQLNSLEWWNADFVQSGLALDLLYYHTTSLGTAEIRTQDELSKQYHHSQELISILIQQLTDHFLLVEMDVQRRGTSSDTRLAHDALAPLVRKYYDTSELPGQRARRILENRVVDWRNGQEGAVLDDADLDLVRVGLDGMRALDDDEERLLQASVAASENRSSHAISRQRTDDARSILDTYPETALLLACEAVRRNQNLYSEQIIRDALDNYPFRVTSFVGHSDAVNSAVFSADGQQFLTASDDGTARLWNLEGDCLCSFLHHQDRVIQAIFSPDTQHILTMASNGVGRLWQLNNPLSVVFEFSTSDEIHEEATAMFSPDGGKILACNKNTVWLWNIRSKKLEFVLNPYNGNAWDAPPYMHAQRIWCTQFSPDGQCILTASQDTTMRLWSLQGEPLTVFSGHDEDVIQTCFGPHDSNLVLSGSMDKMAKLWTTGGELLLTLEGYEMDVGHLAINSNATLLLTASDTGTDTIPRLWNRSGELLATLEAHAGPIRSLEFSPNSRYILTASRDKTARLWNLEGQTISLMQGHLDAITHATFSPDGESILTASADGTARLWHYIDPPLSTSSLIRYAMYLDDNEHILTALTDAQDLQKQQIMLWNRREEFITAYSGRADLEKGQMLSDNHQFLLTAQSVTKEKIESDEFPKNTDYFTSVRLWQLPAVKEQLLTLPNSSLNTGEIFFESRRATHSYMD